MKVNALAAALGCEVITKNHRDAAVKNGYTSDLLSDVLANAGEDAVIITIQAHRNAAAVAFQVGAAAVLVCNNRHVPEDMSAALEKEGIALLRTKDDQFTASYRVYGLIHGKKH